MIKVTVPVSISPRNTARKHAPAVLTIYLIMRYRNWRQCCLGGDGTFRIHHAGKRILVTLTNSWPYGMIRRSQILHATADGETTACYCRMVLCDCLMLMRAFSFMIDVRPQVPPESICCLALPLGCSRGNLVGYVLPGLRQPCFG